MLFFLGGGGGGCYLVSTSHFLFLETFRILLSFSWFWKLSFRYRCIFHYDIDKLILC